MNLHVVTHPDGALYACGCAVGSDHDLPPALTPEEVAHRLLGAVGDGPTTTDDPTASSSPRFEYVQRHRYGYDRDCVLDTLTGKVVVFVTAGLAGSVLHNLNRYPTLIDQYVWVGDIAPRVTEGNTNEQR